MILLFLLAVLAKLMGILSPLGSLDWVVLFLFGAPPIFSSIFVNRRLCDVFQTENGLILQRRRFFRREMIFVPFENIRDVRTTGMFGLDGGKWRIDFETETVFGENVLFLPSTSKHLTGPQLLDELHCKIDAAKGIARTREVKGVEVYRITED